MSSGIIGTRGRALAWVFIYAGGGALVIAVIWILATVLDLTQEVRATQLEGTPTGRRLLESSDQIISCTTPEGECFKRGQERTADAIATLNLGALYAIFCVDRNPDAGIPAIQRCVRDLYEKNTEPAEE